MTKKKIHLLHYTEDGKEIVCKTLAILGGLFMIGAAFGMVLFAPEPDQKTITWYLIVTGLGMIFLIVGISFYPRG